MTIKEAEPKTKKRYTAIFRLHKGGKVIKITHFGQVGGKTYLDEGNKKKRSAFRARHKGDLKTKDYKRPGFLSFYLLWGEHTSLKKNIDDYKNKFNLD
tara:strand:- start:115 stop:408 length:294 start_codon:yes stop_codon:yes gene_type:complete